MEFEPTLSPRFVAYVRDYLLDREIDYVPVFEACDIPLRDGEHDTPFPVPKVAKMLELAAEVSDNSLLRQRNLVHGILGLRALVRGHQ